MFGLAVSFKLQAMFLSPLLLTLVIWRRIPVWQLLVPPLTYLAMMVPAALAGRPWSELLTIYLGQARLKHDLSLNAPNFWWFTRGHGWYPVAVWIGLALGGVVGLFITKRSTRLNRVPVAILLTATVCAALMPAVLPKMTSRYFFVAELLSIGLTFVRPRVWPAAVLIQIGSLIAMSSYFFASWGVATLAFGPMTLGVGILTYEFIRAPPGKAPARAAI
jgi:Gpi18-like mannosyltransferase